MADAERENKPPSHTILSVGLVVTAIAEMPPSTVKRPDEVLGVGQIPDEIFTLKRYPLADDGILVSCNVCASSSVPVAKVSPVIVVISSYKLSLFVSTSHKYIAVDPRPPVDPITEKVASPLAQTATSSTA